MVFLHGSVDEHLVRDVIALFKVVGLEILFHGGGGFQKNLGGAFADGLPGGALGNGFLPSFNSDMPIFFISKFSKRQQKHFSYNSYHAIIYLIQASFI